VVSPIEPASSALTTPQTRRWCRASQASSPQVTTALAVWPDGKIVPSVKTVLAPRCTAAAPSCSGPSRPIAVFARPTEALSSSVATPKVSSGRGSRVRTARTTSHAVASARHTARWPSSTQTERTGSSAGQCADGDHRRTSVSRSTSGERSRTATQSTA
jgi:hypothetical protein